MFSNACPFATELLCYKVDDPRISPIELCVHFGFHPSDEQKAEMDRPRQPGEESPKEYIREAILQHIVNQCFPPE